MSELTPYLETRIERGPHCWIWIGSRSPDGYGLATHGGKSWAAHRLIYMLLVGPIPDGLHLDHVKTRGCSSRACVNPAHLEPVTQAENNARAARARDLTHCPHGHPYDYENTYVLRGVKFCRTCRRVRARALRAAAKKRDRR